MKARNEELLPIPNLNTLRPQQETFLIKQKREEHRSDSDPD